MSLPLLWLDGMMMMMNVPATCQPLALTLAAAADAGMQSWEPCRADCVCVFLPYAAGKWAPACIACVAAS
jgi:hypothetical protein